MAIQGEVACEESVRAGAGAEVQARIAAGEAQISCVVEGEIAAREPEIGRGGAAVRLAAGPRIDAVAAAPAAAPTSPRAA